MWQAITVDAGLFVEWVGNVWIEYPLLDEATGRPAEAEVSYHGMGWREGRFVSWEIGQGVRRYTLGDATPDSLAYAQGWQFAEGQTRRREPAESHGARFYAGWAAGWERRRRDAREARARNTWRD